MHWNWYFFALFCFVIAQYFMSLKCNGRFIVLTPPSPAFLFLAMRTLITLLTSNDAIFLRISTQYISVSYYCCSQNCSSLLKWPKFSVF